MFTTREKIAAARLVYSLVMGGRRLIGMSRFTRVRRDKLIWDIDLAEAIDFTIWLRGRFEPGTLALCERLVRPGAIVLDIGANIGAQTLPLARAVGPTGHVYAFEPTEFAVKKLRANVALNPSLTDRVTVVQCMLSSEDFARLEPQIYSSWPLQSSDDLHATHRGRAMSTEGARVEKLDTTLERLGVTRVDLIKLDVDGHEDSVLAGAMGTLTRDMPPIVMELAPYVYADRIAAFDAMIETLSAAGYRFVTHQNRQLPSQPQQLRALIRDGSGINILALTTMLASERSQR